MGDAFSVSPFDITVSDWFLRGKFRNNLAEKGRSEWKMTKMNGGGNGAGRGGWWVRERRGGRWVDECRGSQKTYTMCIYL